MSNQLKKLMLLIQANKIMKRILKVWIKRYLISEFQCENGETSKNLKTKNALKNALDLG